MRPSAEAGRDRGSMMLAMLLLMVTVALGSLLLVSTIGQAATVRHDQKFTQVLPAADAGIQQGLFTLNNVGIAALPAATAAPGIPGPTTVTASGQTATWFATALTNAGAPPSYLLTATTQGLRRQVQAEAYQSRRFGYGAFADQSIVMRGGNSSSSYNSATGVVSATSNGRLGSNGSVVLNGNATADGVDLYNWTSSPNASRCSGGPCPSGYKTIADPWDISSPASYAFITAQLNACGTSTAFQTSATATHALPTGTWCASSLNFDADTTVTGPTVVYVSGNVTMSPHLNVNYTNGLAPVSPNLQIYSLGSLVDMSNHTNFGGALYAPLATCNGGAQAAIYGSIVCRSISSVGGWQFHYDDALAGLGAGDFRLRHYRES
jgi:hypothetical protein